MGDGLRMQLLPLGAGGQGSSEGEGVREGGSSMVVGPSGGGRAGVPSTGASAEIRGPSDEGGDVSPAGAGPWGPFVTGRGFSDASPSDEFGVAGVPPSRGRRGLRRLLLPSGFWLPSAGPGPWGRPTPTSLRPDSPLFPLYSSIFLHPLPYPP